MHTEPDLKMAARVKRPHLSQEAEDVKLRRVIVEDFHSHVLISVDALIDGPKAPATWKPRTRDVVRKQQRRLPDRVRTSYPDAWTSQR